MSVEASNVSSFEAAVANHFQTRAKSQQLSAQYELTQAMAQEVETVDWDRRLPEVINPSGLISSMAAALHYAHIKTGRGDDYFGYFKDTQTEAWRGIIRNTLADEEMSNTFYRNLGRPVVTVAPERGTALQYILAAESKRVRRPLAGVDLGAGAHIALPMLNSPTYTEQWVPHKERLLSLLEGDITVEMSLGLGVDRQDGRGDKDWLLASVWPAPDYGGIYRYIKDADITANETTFPFLVADLLDPATEEKIQDRMRNGGVTGGADFVLTSYVAYLLRQVDAYDQLESLVLSTLRPGGIWIDIGEELVDYAPRARTTDDGFLRRSIVHVYRARLLTQKDTTSQNEVIYNMERWPFALEEQRFISKTNLEYFARPYATPSMLGRSAILMGDGVVPGAVR